MKATPPPIFTRLEGDTGVFFLGVGPVGRTRRFSVRLLQGVMGGRNAGLILQDGGYLDFGAWLPKKRAGDPNLDSHGCIHLNSADAEWLFNWPGKDDVGLQILGPNPHSEVHTA